MHAAVIGAGALGAVYGVRLGATGTTVSFVVREARAQKGGALQLEQLDHDKAKHTLAAPSYVTAVPGDADVVLVTVRQDQLDLGLAKLLAPSSAPVVVLTPMFEEDAKRLEAAIGRPVFAAMPSVVAYDKNGTIRYWLPRAATTAVEAKDAPPALEELTEALVAAGIDAKLKTNVLAENVATTVSFMPIAFGLDAAGGVDAFLGDKHLLRNALDAVNEMRDLAKKVGTAAPWASLLLHFVGPLMIRAGVAIAKSRAPEAIDYVEDHFGRKLHAQNVRMAAHMLALAQREGVRAEELANLVHRLNEVA